MNEKNIVIIPYQSEYKKFVKEIFYLSSSVKEFNSEEHKELFFKKWCGDYIENYANTFLLMIETRENKLLGYLSGCNNSLSAQDVLKVPGFALFNEFFEQFPAHLHINFHPSARGMGLGSKLVNYYSEELKKLGICGVHLVTSSDALNISFYKKLGFTNCYTRQSGSSQLLFMGKYLTE